MPMARGVGGKDVLASSTDSVMVCVPLTDRCAALDCLKLTKSMQRAADTFQSVADIYDDHARRTQLITHEALKGVSHPYTTYAVRHS